MTRWERTRARWQAEKQQAQHTLDRLPDEAAYDQRRDQLEAFIRTRDKRLALLPPPGNDQ